jgi:hypothetical protein
MPAQLRDIPHLSEGIHAGLFVVILVCMTAYRLYYDAPSPKSASTHRSGILKANTLLASMGLLLCAVFFCALFSYLLFPNYLDHVEPLVAAISAQYAHGMPIYPLWNHGEGIYGLPYGPALFQLNALVLAIFPTIAGSKLLGILMPILAAFLQYFTISHIESDRNIRLRLIALSIIIFSTSYYCFEDRGDSFLLMLSSLCMFAFYRLRPVPAAIIIGLAAGLAIDIKIHAFLYFLAPALGLLARQNSAMRIARYAVIGVACAVVAALLPFAFPDVDISRYAAYLFLAGSVGWDPILFVQNILLVLALAAIPAAAYFVQRPQLDRDSHIFLFSAAAMAVLVAIAAAAPGAGPHHLLPFAPIAIIALAKVLAAPRQRPLARSETLNAIFLSALITFGVVGFSANAYVIDTTIRTAAVERLKLKELLNLHGRFPQAEMGLSDFDHYSDTYLYPALAFDGSKLRFVGASWEGLQAAGVNSSYTIDLLTGCNVAAWILPSHGAPFTSLSLYTIKPLMSGTFLETFYRNYHLTAHGKYFDVWQCRSART